MLNAKEVLVAWVLAQELAIRIGCAVQSRMPETYVPSGLMGAIGVAALGSRLFGSPSQRLILNKLDPDLGICTDLELVDKFEQYAEWGVGRKRANRLRKSVLSLRSDKPGAVKEFLDSLLCPLSN